MVLRAEVDPYLRQCRDDFAAVTARRYGRPFDLAAIERRVSELRTGARGLRYEDLRFFQDEEHWWFRNFWVFPPEEHLAAELAERTFDFWNLPKREEATIQDLYEVFRSIEHASIVLRFVRPDHYGILSPPVARMLEIRRGGSAVRTYLHYLHDLREIRDRGGYGLDTAADVDMALWVLHERCFGTFRDPEIERCFLADPFMAQLRARNLVAPLADLTLPQLAQALAPTVPALAALIACHRLEIQIRTAAEKLGLPIAFANVELHNVIDELKPHWAVAVERGHLWRSFVELRNDLFHKDVLRDSNRIDHLVAEVVQLERDLDEL